MAMEYVVVMSTASPGHLTNQVNSMIRDGWTLLGGVSVSSATGAGTSLFCQAMTKGGPK